MTIEIWGKPACPHCDQAKRICEQRNLNFVYKQLGVDFEREEIMEQFPGARTFPQIRIDGKAVGGKDQFITYLEETGYNGTAHTL